MHGLPRRCEAIQSKASPFPKMKQGIMIASRASSYNQMRAMSKTKNGHSLKVGVAVVAPGERTFAVGKLADERVMLGERVGASVAARRFAATHMTARHADARRRARAAFFTLRARDIQ